MGAFEYLAYDPKGKERKGVLEGDSPRQIRAQLREQGMLPLSVEAVSEREATRGPSVGMRRGISAADLAIITRQLATLSRAGLPLDEATSTVARQTEKPRLKRLLLGVRAKVMEGHTLADGFKEFPHVFPDLYRSTVSAGEQSGHLDVVLERLADYTEQRQQLRSRIQLALFYPLILTTMAIVVVVGLLTYVVPEVVKVFEDTGQQLPLLTRILIAVSDFLRDNLLWLVLLIGAALGTFSYLVKQPGPRHQIHRLYLRMPLISRLVRGVNTARFARTLSILVASGVPLLEALRIAAEVMSNLPMRFAVEEAAHRVREGGSLSGALEQSGYFPPMATNLIASGEVSGNLEEMLERAAVNQERELETIISTLMGLMEPVLILTMGAVVLVIVLAILLPIFDLNQLVK
ncbi:MAG: type II secretion system inner membrane protein GspF [Pseudomonadota bacterium]|nr:MAG: type II secretion system inner membrane protein GspF [Pseudomonadota bacterium]